jgi:hypothetical protein
MNNDSRCRRFFGRIGEWWSFQMGTMEGRFDRTPKTPEDRATRSGDERIRKVQARCIARRIDHGRAGDGEGCGAVMACPGGVGRGLTASFSQFTVKATTSASATAPMTR